MLEGLTHLNQATCTQMRQISDKKQRRQWHPTPVLLPGKSHGWRSLEGCSPWGRWGSDTTERLHFHFSLSYIGEGNGNPLQCSCLENPRDGGAWWAAVYGVAKRRTQLKQLSSSSSNNFMDWLKGLETVQSTEQSVSKWIGDRQLLWGWFIKCFCDSFVYLKSSLKIPPNLPL